MPNQHTKKAMTPTSQATKGVRITTFSQLQTRILGFQQQYNVMLHSSVNWNTPLLHGFVPPMNTFAGEAWIKNNGITYLTDPVSSPDRTECANLLLDKITDMLKQYAGQVKQQAKAA